MKLILALSFLLLAGCATSDYHNATLERVMAACSGEVEKVDHEVSDYRKRLRFECR